MLLFTSALHDLGRKPRRGCLDASFSVEESELRGVAHARDAAPAADGVPYRYPSYAENYTTARGRNNTASTDKANRWDAARKREGLTPLSSIAREWLHGKPRANARQTLATYLAGVRLCEERHGVADARREVERAGRKALGEAADAAAVASLEGEQALVLPVSTLPTHLWSKSYEEEVAGEKGSSRRRKPVVLPRHRPSLRPPRPPPPKKLRGGSYPSDASDDDEDGAEDNEDQSEAQGGSEGEGDDDDDQEGEDDDEEEDDEEEGELEEEEEEEQEEGKERQNDEDYQPSMDEDDEDEDTDDSVSKRRAASRKRKTGLVVPLVDLVYNVKESGTATKPPPKVPATTPEARPPTPALWLSSSPSSGSSSEDAEGGIPAPTKRRKTQQQTRDDRRRTLTPIPLQNHGHHHHRHRRCHQSGGKVWPRSAEAATSVCSSSPADVASLVTSKSASRTSASAMLCQERMPASSGSVSLAGSKVHLELQRAGERDVIFAKEDEGEGEERRDHPDGIGEATVTVAEMETAAAFLVEKQRREEEQEEQEKVAAVAAVAISRVSGAIATTVVDEGRCADLFNGPPTPVLSVDLVDEDDDDGVIAIFDELTKHLPSPPPVAQEETWEESQHTAPEGTNDDQRYPTSPPAPVPPPPDPLSSASPCPSPSVPPARSSDPEACNHPSSSPPCQSQSQGKSQSQSQDSTSKRTSQTPASASVQEGTSRDAVSRISVEVDARTLLVHDFLHSDVAIGPFVAPIDYRISQRGEVTHDNGATPPPTPGSGEGAATAAVVDDRRAWTASVRFVFALVSLEHYDCMAPPSLSSFRVPYVGRRPRERQLRAFREGSLPFQPFGVRELDVLFWSRAIEDSADLRRWLCASQLRANDLRERAADMAVPTSNDFDDGGELFEINVRRYVEYLEGVARLLDFADLCRCRTVV